MHRNFVLSQQVNMGHENALDSDFNLDFTYFINARQFEVK